MKYFWVVMAVVAIGVFAVGAIKVSQPVPPHQELPCQHSDDNCLVVEPIPPENVTGPGGAYRYHELYEMGSER